MKTLVLVLIATALVLSAADANVAGKWSGSFSRTQPDGTSQSDTAIANLQQEGGRITGTAGPDEENSWPVEKGTIAADKVTFQVTDPRSGNLFKCALTLAGDRLKGPMTVVMPDGPTFTVTLDLTRVK